MWSECGKKGGPFFVEDDTHKVNVGSRGKVMVIVIVGETIIWTSVIKWIKLLACPTLWPIHTNKRETT